MTCQTARSGWAWLSRSRTWSNASQQVLINTIFRTMASQFPGRSAFQFAAAWAKPIEQARGRCPWDKV